MADTEQIERRDGDDDEAGPSLRLAQRNYTQMAHLYGGDGSPTEAQRIERQRVRLDCDQTTNDPTNCRNIDYQRETCFGARPGTESMRTFYCLRCSTLRVGELTRHLSDRPRAREADMASVEERLATLETRFVQFRDEVKGGRW